MTPADWRRRALWLCGLTIAYNVLEGLVGMAFGWADDSVALFGFGAESAGCSWPWPRASPGARRCS